MLEQPVLRLMPWMRDPAAEPARGSPIRPVVAAGRGAVLGSVRLARGVSWLGLGPRRLEVCETEDAALLMSIEQGWFAFGRWQVLDAERCRVGAVVGNHLLDAQGSRVATLWRENDGSSTIRDRHDKVLVRLESAADGVQTLQFANDLSANPFLRMVLLAACVLCRER